jgi:hypothetical protein
VKYSLLRGYWEYKYDVDESNAIITLKDARFRLSTKYTVKILPNLWRSVEGQQSPSRVSLFFSYVFVYTNLLLFSGEKLEQEFSYSFSTCPNRITTFSLSGQYLSPTFVAQVGFFQPIDPVVTLECFKLLVDGKCGFFFQF